MQGLFPLGLRKLKSLGVSINVNNEIGVLSLPYNEFKGSIPEWLCELGNLTILDLFVNKFQGSIPECIGAMNLLGYLALGNNELSGTFPIGICDLVNLYALWLDSNFITGMTHFLFKGSIPACIGALIKLRNFGLSNRMKGQVPESIGQLIILEELYLGWIRESNIISGPLPSSMRKLVLLEELYLNIATLSGPLPDFSRLTRLSDCAFTPSQMCIIPEYISLDSACDFSVLPECKFPDCEILAEWLPNMFDVYACCEVNGVTCEEDLIVILDLSPTMTGQRIDGFIPISIGELGNLQKLYLQDNFLEGNLPLSISNISSLQIVDISNNFLSGLIPFKPSFDIIGLASNWDLSLPIDLATIIDSATETPELSQNMLDSESSINFLLIIGISAGFLLIVLLVIAVVILFKRREQGKETEIELRLLPKYSSPNKQIRLMNKIKSGGFGVVWKARYKGQTVAVKLIRMDKERNLKNVKMVVDESSIMRIMVHERIVRFILFEIESLGIVLEYLPLGSLYDYIRQCRGVMEWTDRY
jgi:hypothetical protein